MNPTTAYGGPPPFDKGGKAQRERDNKKRCAAERFFVKSAECRMGRFAHVYT